MAIDVQPPNYSGLATIAGKSAALNLQPTGALGLQALQQQQSNDAALRASALAHMQLQQQGQLGLLSNQNQAQQNATQQQATNQQGQYQQGVLQNQAQQNATQQQATTQQGAYQQGELADTQQKTALAGKDFQDNIELRNRILAETTAKDQMAANLAASKQTIQDKGAFASYGLMSMNGAKTPDQADQIRTEIINEALAKKYMTQDEADTAKALPISQFTNGLSYKVMQYGQAKEYKDMVAANKSPTSGVSLNVGSDGSLQYNSTPTPATTTKTQESIDTDNQMLQSLGELKNTFNQKYLTYAGRGTKEISQEAEKLQGIPILGTAADYVAQATTGLNQEDRSKYIDQSTQYLHSAGQLFQKYIQSMAGSRVSAERIQQFEALFANPSMSPTEYKSGITQLLRDIQQEKEGNQAIIKNGINITPPVNSGTQQTDLNAARIQNLKAKGYSDQEINNYLQGGK